MVEYKNRYRDVYTFTLLEDKNVLWEGSFEYHRVSFPNVYKEAYQQYRKDGGDMHIEDFKEEVHKYDDATFKPSEIAQKYRSLVYSDMNTIDMVDPSGGPYITEGMDMEWIDKSFKGRIVSSFVPVETGYLIQTYGEFDHLKERSDE